MQPLPQNLLTYALGGHREVEGWLGMGAISMLVMLDQFQKRENVRGSICEIGVHHGRLFILLA